MGAFTKLTYLFSFVALCATFIHRPIPADVPDFLHFQIVIDCLSVIEGLASITEWFGIWNRWWSYPGNFDYIPVALPTPSDIDIQFAEFSGVKSALIATKAFKDRSPPGPALVYIHGGGWVSGSYQTHKNVYVQAAEETGFLVMAPEYRKAPHHPFPIPFEDCLNSTIEFMRRAKEYNVDPNKIVIIGDSAGGNLAMAVSMELIKMKENDDSIFQPAMTTLIYPVLQMANYQLPSYQQNEPFMFYNNLVPKFWLAYIGLNQRLDLAEVIAVNGHIRPEMEEKVQIVSSALVPERCKVRGYNSSKIPLTSYQKLVLDEDALDFIETKYMDKRIAPLMSTDEDLAKMPRTHVLVCEYDALRDEGILLYERLKKLNINVTLQYLPSALHATVSIGAVFPSTYYGKENTKLYATIKNYFP